MARGKIENNQIIEGIEDQPTMTPFPSEVLPRKVRARVTSPFHTNLEDIVVGFNGTLYQIKLNVPVDLPWEVYQILCDAKIRKINPSTGQEYTVSRFNVEFLGSM